MMLLVNLVWATFSITICSIVWLAFGLLNYGATLGYFTHKWPEFSHRKIRPLLVSGLILGPLGVVFTVSDWPGLCNLRWRHLSDDERWSHFQRIYHDVIESGVVTREDFGEWCPK